MSVTRDFGDVIFMCDECDNYLETGEKDFAEAVRIAKRGGWIMLLEDGEWAHICGECVADGEDEDDDADD